MEITKYANGNTVVLLSGMFGGGWMWDQCRPHICNSDVLGISEPLCAMGKTIDDVVKVVTEGLKQRLEKPAVLVGNSLGSLICLRVATECPELVERLVLSGSAGFSIVKIADLGFNLSRNARTNAEGLSKLVCHDHDKLAAQPEHVDRLAAHFKRYFGAITRLMVESNNSVYAGPLLDKVNCPVHAIWGANDILTPIETAREALARNGASIDLIEDCGHSPMSESPEDFARVLNQYLIQETQAHTA